MNDLTQSQLGKATHYHTQYNPELLFTVPRADKRALLGIKDPLPFSGCDVWNAYELSWLDEQGKPRVAIGEFIIPCHAPNILESKSFKLYLHSFNQTTLPSIAALHDRLFTDLSEVVGEKIECRLYSPHEFTQLVYDDFQGICIDDLPVHCHDYHINPALLKSQGTTVKESLTSNLLKSNCPMTGQPDWASILIDYHGPQIDREGLLAYLISYREHTEFHEQCIERIFVDLMKYCQLTQLTVYARYTRRGGIDINPFRSTENLPPKNHRLPRQ